MYRLPLMAAATSPPPPTPSSAPGGCSWAGCRSTRTARSSAWVVARTLEEGAHDISVGLKVLDHPWLEVPLAVGMLVTTIAEIPLSGRPGESEVPLVWLAVIAASTVSTLFLMNIFFWENLILLAVLFTPLPALLRAQKAGPSRRRLALDLGQVLSDPDVGRREAPPARRHPPSPRRSAPSVVSSPAGFRAPVRRGPGAAASTASRSRRRRRARSSPV